jgi:hypothetical protein
MPDARAPELRVIVQEWHSRALPVIRTKDFATTWVDFVVAWERIRVPESDGDIITAIMAKARAMRTPEAGLVYDTEPMRLLVALCAALQEYHGSSSWPLSCRVAGECIGVSHMTAARMLKTLCFDGAIEMTRAAGSKHSETAAEYRYLGT